MVVNSSQGTAGSKDGGAANSDAPIVSNLVNIMYVHHAQYSKGTNLVRRETWDSRQQTRQSTVALTYPDWRSTE